MPARPAHLNLPHRTPEPEERESVPVIPDHDVVRFIDRGSYGDVWLARNRMGTFRAVKIVRRSSFSDTRPFERELAGIRKFEPISRSHEGFVDVLQIGMNEEAGYFYYVMELGDDRNTEQHIDPEHYTPKTLAQEIATRRRIPFAECLRLGLTLSNALEKLHEHKLVHRDIKPSNIIFVNGVPKLADIGLVIDIGEARSFVGTEGFIPPEGPGATQADIYSLGKVLYEAGTGKDRRDFPELPDDLLKLPDREELTELNEVLVKACHHDPSQRYETATKLHADLTVLLNGKSVHRLRQLERRFTAFKRIGLVGSVVLALGGAMYFYFYEQRKHAAELRLRQIGAHVAYGTRALEEGDAPEALSWFVEAARLDRDNPRREQAHLLRVKTVLGACPKITRMWFEDGQVSHIEFSPTGEHLLITRWFGQAQIRSVETGEAVSPRFGPSQGLSTARFSPDGKSVLTASEDMTASLWDSKTGEELLQLRHPEKVFDASFSPDGASFATACKDGRLRLWTGLKGTLVREITAHRDAILHVAFSPDGQFLVTASKDNTAQVWHIASGERVGAPLEHESWVFDANFSPAGEWVVTAGADRKARRWVAKTGREIVSGMSHSDGVRSASFSPDGRYIVTAGWDGTAKLWDTSTGQIKTRNGILRHTGRGVMHATFAPDGHRLATGSVDGTVRIWDLAANANLPVRRDGLPSSDGSRLLVQEAGSINLMRTGSFTSTVLPLSNNLVPRELSENGQYLLAWNGTNRPGVQVQVLESDTGKAVSPLITITNFFAKLHLNRDGQLLVHIADSGVGLIDVRSGAQLAGTTFPSPGTIEHVCVDPQKRHIALVTGKRVYVWEIYPRKLRFPSLQHAMSVTHAEFSPDSRTLVTSAADNTLNESAAYLWDAESGTLRFKLPHRDGVSHATFSSDQAFVATASEDFTARIWSVKTGSPVTPPLKHAHRVLRARFSPDARWLATVTVNGHVRLWDAETGDPLSPTFEQPEKFSHLAFALEYLLTSGEGGAFFWSLSPGSRNLTDISLLSDLLAGNPQHGDGRDRGLLHEMLRTNWYTLMARVPDMAIVSAEEVLAWHEKEAHLAEEHHDWFGALFHLEALIAARPSDKALRERKLRLERAHAARPREAAIR